MHIIEEEDNAYWFELLLSCISLLIMKPNYKQLKIPVIQDSCYLYIKY